MNSADIAAAEWPFASPARRRLVIVLCVGVLLAAVAGISRTPMLLDEHYHFAQITRFLRGHYAPVPELTTIPGFHALVAVVERAFASESLGIARAVTTAFALAAIAAFAGIRRVVAPAEDPLLPTLQFLFLPLAFPLSFLVYTDVPSLALVLWTLRASLGGHHRLAGALAIAAVLVRQTNIVWIVFVALLQALELRTAHPTPGARGRAAIGLWPYAASAALFAAFWWWNGTISLSPSMAPLHPDLRLHGGNLYFMLFLAALLLSPLMPAWLRRYVQAVRTRPSLLLIPLALGALYPLAFVVDHPFNQVAPEYFLRNFALLCVERHAWAQAAFGAVAVVAACALTQVRWRRASFALLIAFAALFVSASWLIEQRYYIIPFALMLAFREPEDRRLEVATLVLWIPIAAGLFYVVASETFFL